MLKDQYKTDTGVHLACEDGMEICQGFDVCVRSCLLTRNQCAVVRNSASNVLICAYCALIMQS